VVGAFRFAKQLAMKLEFSHIFERRFSMNQKMQKCTTWRPLGIQGETLMDEWTAYSLNPLGEQTAVSILTFLTIDQSKSCGFRRNARVINF
jgi:hypothetical protein